MINASILFTVDGVKQRAPLIPVHPADKALDGIVEFDPTTKSFRVKKDIVIHSIEIERDAFINGNAIVAGDLEVRGTTFSSEVENVQADGDWIVLRANNPTPLAAGDYSGFVFHNYNNLGKDAAITVDNTGTFRISTQTSEAVSPLSNVWLVDEEYFIENVDFSQATLMSENYPVTRYSEVFTDIEAYKANNTHYFYDPDATPIEYHDNVVYNNVTQKVELAGNVVSFTPSSSDVHHEVHFYTSISFMEPQASDMEAIATRDETSNWDNNEIAMYDKTDEKFVGIGTPVQNNTYLKAQIDPNTGDISYGWGAGGGNGVAFIGTRAQYEVAKLIPVGTDGHIPSGSLVVITDEQNYTMGDEQ